MSAKKRNSTVRGKKQDICDIITLQEHPQLKHPQFWAGIAIVLLISVIGILSIVEQNPALTGAFSVQNIAFVKQGTSMSLEVKNVPGLQRVTLHFSADVKSGQVRFEEDSSIPFKGKAIAKLLGSANEAVKISSIDLLLKVKESDISAAGLKPEQVVLYNNDKALDTTPVQVESLETGNFENREKYVYYTATSPGLGNFVIGEATPEIAPQKPAQATEPPKKAPTTEIPTEKPIEPVIQQPTSLVGKAMEEPQEPVKVGFFSRIWQFLKGLFG